MQTTTDRRRQVLAIARARRLAQDGGGRRIREASGLALQHIADAVGVGVGTVWRWENGRNTPCGAAAARWAELLDELQQTVDGPDAA